MRDWVAEWRQEGEIFVWRYPKQSKHAGEWHFTGDPVGCRSIRNLIDRMAGGEACHRTMRLWHRAVRRSQDKAVVFLVDA